MAPNRAPQGGSNTVTTPTNTAYAFTPSDFGFADPNDTPPDNFQAVEITTLPSAGTLTDNGVPVSAGAFVSVSDISSGLFVFTPATNATGTPYTSFTFQVRDDGGTADGGADTDPTPRTMTIDVSPITAVVTLTSSLSPAQYTQPVILTATVAQHTGVPSGTPTGQVDFYDNGVYLGSGILSNGVATLTAGSLGEGTHTITASYDGNTVFDPTASAPLTQTVNPNGTTVSLTSSLNPAQYSQSVTLSATVSLAPGALSGTPTGQVEFSDNGYYIGSAPLTNGVASITTNLPVGSDSITATYDGDSLYDLSTSAALTQTVNANPTVITLTCSQSTSNYGQMVTFTATVARAAGSLSGTPTGEVDFYADGVDIGSGMLNNGVATFGTSTLSVGNHAIIAVYEGDSIYDPIISAALQQIVVSSVPTVTSVSPNSGSTAGGTSVTITGTNFVSGSSVSFGSLAATSVTYVSSTQLTAVSPAESAGTVDITVTTSAGTSATSSADQFTFVSAPAPTVTNVSPNSGSTSGSTTVSISGTNFQPGSSVFFGTVSGMSVTFVSSTQLTAVSPPESAGTVDITVTTNGGTSATSSADQFTFVSASAPTVTNVSPNSGSTSGGTWVTIMGTNFGPGSIVYFGTVQASNVQVISSTEIMVLSPPHVAGMVDITVVSGGFTSQTSVADEFTYF